MHSVKEFVSHCLMIVLGVLTALGIEAFLEHLHHVHAAEAAQEAIEAELQDNVAQVKAANNENIVRLTPPKALARLIDAMTDARVQNVDPTSFLHAIDQAIVTLQAMQYRLDTLESAQLDALPADKAETARRAAPKARSPATGASMPASAASR